MCIGIVIALGRCVVEHVCSFALAIILQLDTLPKHLDWFALGKLNNACEEVKLLDFLTFVDLDGLYHRERNSQTGNPKERETN